ncbi:helix-turn-helix transcriptional regulator [Streptomyces sp. NBC_00117]|uniref:Helix-turn-helix transcriptional regulator n=2 Tax=unclassified Streptomyces TaxID=2593676 RepID=A0AAU1U3J8_9ACTN|nr:helix-turn-helix domain-containing protein [Streptomyces sp. NBC_01445]WSE08840.1 helix-turn-helix transcriptional regulator [Streptomyces sp. NBC_01445]
MISDTRSASIDACTDRSHSRRADQSPAVTANSDESDGGAQTMARLRAALAPTDSHWIDAAEEELFEHVSAQLSRFNSTQDNPIVNVVDHLGNYWRNWLLVIARTGPYRPSTIRRIIAALVPERPISQRMLTLNLRMLERDGLIVRHVFDDECRHVEYSLSPIGMDLSDRVMSLIGWAERHSGEIEAAREAFDERR